MQVTSPGGVRTEKGQNKLASLDDITESMKQQLLILVEWAKYIPVFSDLTLDDQVSVETSIEFKNF